MRSGCIACVFVLGCSTPMTVVDGGRDASTMDTGCTITFSGALSTTEACGAWALDDSFGDASGASFGVSAPRDRGPVHFSMRCNKLGPLAPGTYPSDSWCDVEINSTVQNEFRTWWIQPWGIVDAGTDVGFSLHVDTVNPTMTYRLNMAGTAQGTLPGRDDAGDVSFQATFAWSL